MKKLATVFLLLCRLCAHGHVGDTIDQSVLLYGAPIEKKSGAALCDQLVFHKGSFEITAQFYNRVCTRIEYVKVDENELPQLLTDQEEAAILKENGGGKAWGPVQFEKLEDGSYLRSWYGDIGYQAQYTETSPCLRIQSSDSSKYDAAVSAKEAAEGSAAAAKTTLGL